MEAAAFSIDRYPVTNEEYERMVPGHRRSEYSDADRQPVINVSWFEARLYARWRGRECRLPAEQEWEKAAAWDSEAAQSGFPWGDAFDAARCNTRESGLQKTISVDAYPAGASAYGVHDMAGNVREWIDSLWDDGSDMRVFRGGSWDYYHGIAACAFRYLNYPDDRSNGVGFRCART